MQSPALAAASPTFISPHDGAVAARQQLQDRFRSRLAVRPDLSRQLVSWQGNRKAPGFRWLKYKEGFAHELVQRLIGEAQAQAVLDPFAGIGTAPLLAAGQGLAATGIEIMPVGVLGGRALVAAAQQVTRHDFEQASRGLLRRIESARAPAARHAFQHVRITSAAFPDETETGLAKARSFIATVHSESLAIMLNLACMSVLESVSFTRKDGQYLRWDYRSRRTLRTHKDLGPVVPLPTALRQRLAEMSEDIAPLQHQYGAGAPTLLQDSCLQALQRIPAGSFDTVITSPPYANRYDYTRTYALELAWLGLGETEFRELRQQLLTATVENKPKTAWLQELYGESPLMQAADTMYAQQAALHEVVGVLRHHEQDLANRQILRLLEGYFREMALVIAELGRVVCAGGNVYMVNDNVQYHGEEVPVDLILADMAEQAGFECRHIWVLARGKGNSSQQMKRFGRRELRKCLYHWVRSA